MIKSVIIFLLQLVLIASLAWLAREAWTARTEEKLNLLFEKEGRPVFVHIATVSQERKIWKDYIGNSKYIGFTYHGRDYSLRYLQDSGWIGSGSDIWLSYHPGLDLFRQPNLLYHRVANMKISKLINWTIAGTFSYANRWLFVTAALVILIAVMASSLLAKITGWALFQILSRWLVIVCFAGGGLFLTWDAWAHYTYYQQLKTNGVQTNLAIVEKNRARFPGKDNSAITSYDYMATVKYQQELREIPISGSDYDRLAPGDNLPVLYDAGMDDMMAQDYTLSYWRILFLIVMWIVIFYILRKNRQSPG